LTFWFLRTARNNRVGAMGSKKQKDRPEERRSRPRGGTGRRGLWLGGAVALVGALAATGMIWFGGAGQVSHAYTLAPESTLPTYFRKAPPNVREAYRFAIANRGILQQIPCYCGCGADGHKNNADCYIKNVKPDGTVDFDNMSFG
jgi:hypothetical protein